MAVAYQIGLAFANGLNTAVCQAIVTGYGLNALLHLVLMSETYAEMCAP